MSTPCLRVRSVFRDCPAACDLRQLHRRYEKSERGDLMEVLVHCDEQVCRSEELIRRVEGVFTGTLEQYGERISRVEATLRDLNSGKSGDRDKICSVEAQIAGSAAQVLVTHEATTLTEAIHDAADKLKRLVARELQQLDETLGNPQANPTARPL
jgi:ribosome-associated translation inhibitor RaiA